MHTFLPVITSSAAGFAAFILVWTLGSGKIPRSRFNQFPPLERQRRERARAAKPFYARVEVLISDIRPFVAAFLSENHLKLLKKSLQFSVAYKDMEADEFLALKIFEGSLAGVVVGAIVSAVFGFSAAALCGLVVMMLSLVLSQAEVFGIAARYKSTLLARLPSSVDLLSLMLEAGATFPESLSTVARENRGHPLGEQLGQVESEMALGRPRADALRGLRDRLDDPTIDEFVMAINEGEEFGTPLARILSSQAERMRLKKSQWIEKAAAEAQVKMAFPSLLIMIGCSLVVIGPFVLQGIFEFMGEN